MPATAGVRQCHRRTEWELCRQGPGEVVKIGGVRIERAAGGLKRAVDEAFAQREGDGLEPGVHTQLGQQVANVGAYGGGSDAEGGGDLGAGAAPRQ
jgi:hypothetical protein